MAGTDAVDGSFAGIVICSYAVACNERRESVVGTFEKSISLLNHGSFAPDNRPAGTASVLSLTEGFPLAGVRASHGGW